MTLSTSLSAAMSGLSAASRAAEIVSSNVANALTEGYGRRELNLASRVVGQSGQGVSVQGVTRHSDAITVGDRRLAQSRNGANTATAAFMKQLESSLGTPDSATSLTGRVSAFDTALKLAASRPESDARLSEVLQTASALTAHISKVGASIQTARSTADGQIANQVDQLNTALSQIADLNANIRIGQANGRDTSALADQRQQAIDSISAIIPMHEVQRSGGAVALYTTGGSIVLDGRPALFEFTPVGVIVPGMTQASGALSGLTMNGRMISTASEGGPISGGTLAAQFAIRDVLGPDAQSNLDAVARDLVERFSDPSIDPSLASGAAGLFNDSGGAFVAANEVGLSLRLGVSSLFDPAKGGDLWRLRDGLGAAAPGPIGDASLINRYSGALDAARSPVSGSFSGGTRSFATLASDITSAATHGRLTSENDATYAAATLETLKSVELNAGVDTDQEMQTLLMIEQAFSANAKVISVVNDLMQTLLDI